MTSTDLLTSAGAWEGLGRLVAAVEGPDAEPTAGITAASIELALEGLWLTRRIDKDESDGRARYGAVGAD